jgi:hypothetical protein
MAAAASIDRRWIFAAMGLLVLVLYALGTADTIPVSEYVQSYYDTIEALPEGSIVMLSADFDPAGAAEIEPMYIATIHHLFRRNLRIINVATWPAAPPFTKKHFSAIAPLYAKTYGVDWVELGYTPGDDVAIALMSQSLKSAYTTDDRNQTPLSQIPLLDDVSDSFRGISLLISSSAGYPGILEWIAQAGGRYQVPLLTGTTAIQTTGLYAYYPNQLKGFLGAFTGATQYLQLVGDQTKEPTLQAKLQESQKRMLVQSWSHMLIIGLIVVGNVLYFAGRRRRDA